MKGLHVAIFLISLLLLASAVSAETVSGNLSTGEGWKSNNYYSESASSTYWFAQYDYMTIVNQEYTTGLKSFIHFDSQGKYGQYSGIFSTNNSMTDIPFIVLDQNDVKMGDGIFGYQRNFVGFPATETNGYQWWMFNHWNSSTSTGTHLIRFVYLFPQNASSYVTYGDYGYTPAGDIPTGYIVWQCSPPHNSQYVSGNYTFNRDIQFQNSYSATRPSGLGISGYVIKSLNPLSASRVYVLNATSGTVIASENNVNINTYNFTTINQPIRISIFSSNGDWYNTSTIFASNITPTPTPTPHPTPIASGVYTLTVDHAAVNQSGTNIATISSLIDPTLADLDTIVYTWYDSGGNPNLDTPFHEVGSSIHSTAYAKIGGTWYGYDESAVDYNNAKAGVPSPITLKWDTTTGNKILKAVVRTTNAEYATLTTPVIVGNGNVTLVNTQFQAMDGLNGGVIQNVAMQIHNKVDGTWKNTTPQRGLGEILSSPNAVFDVYAQKAGYTDGTLFNVTARASPEYPIMLYPATVTPIAGASFEYITVMNAAGAYIGGATITVTAGSQTIYGTTPSEGSLRFNVTASTVYSYTVRATGYRTTSGSFTSPASGGSHSTVVTMYPPTTPTGTYTYPTTPGVTPTTLQITNQTTSFWQPWVNVFTTMGANNSEIPLLLAGLIIVLGMAAGAGMAGVLGAEVGMGFASIICVGVGLIPIWIVLAIIILGFLFYGLKVIR